MNIQRTVFVAFFCSLVAPKEICGDYTNVALGKVATQSSLYEYAQPGENGASLAVDGNAIDSTDVPMGQCTHTNFEINPYWQVDLGREYEITKVIVTNRGDCCGDRFNSVLVTIGNTMPPNQNCAHFIGPGTTAEQIEMNCPSVLTGRYVRLQNTKSDRQFMTMCEVQVLEKIGNRRTLFLKDDSEEVSNAHIWSSEPTRNELECARKCKQDGQCVFFIARDVEDGTAVLCEVLHTAGETTASRGTGKLYKKTGL